MRSHTKISRKHGIVGYNWWLQMPYSGKNNHAMLAQSHVGQIAGISAWYIHYARGVTMDFNETYSHNFIHIKVHTYLLAYMGGLLGVVLYADNFTLLYQ